jgi:hypothetical protein
MSFIPGNSGSAAQAPDGLRGLTAGTDAAAGVVGEYIFSTLTQAGAGITLTTGVIAAITSISLSPGDWDISANIGLKGTATSLTNFLGLISVTSASFAAIDNGRIGGFGGTTNLNTFDVGFPLPTLRVNITSLTTYFMNIQTTFTGGTCTAYGTLRARRVR